MGSSSVVGGKGAWWAAEDGVEVDAECEREQALGDSCDEAGKGLGEVIVQAHLAFEGREHRFDDEPDARLGDLDDGGVGWSCAWSG